MTMQLDVAALTSSAQALDERASEMASRRTQIEAAVESLLAHWRGDAARRFAAHWEEWRSSADAVIDGLTSNVARARLCGDQLAGADRDAGDAHDRLLGRLG